MRKYIHTSMTNGRYFRILTLYAGGADDQLRGELEIVNIDRFAGEYETISYVWGSQSKTQNMVCNGAEILITKSLHGALTRLRLAHASRRLWADQICIDQSNADEKSAQIPLMDVIYRNAGHVLVWLGHDEGGIAPTAFSLVNRLAATFADERRREEFDRGHSDSQGRCPEPKVAWSSLRALTGLPWFTRAWVVQEIGTRVRATLFWGDASIGWEILHSVCKALTEYHHLRKHVNVQTPKIKYMYRRFIEPDRTSRHANRFSFLYELHRARHLSATDPRDRVYAMLGHYSIRNSPNQKLRALKPDYMKTLEEVYVDVAIRGLIGDDKNLLTLASVQHDSLPSRQVLGGSATTDYSSTISPNKLPSWVPDWRVYQSHILSEPTSPHHASGTLPPSLEVDGPSKTLRIRGVLVDTVVKCSEPFGPREFHVDGSAWSTAIEKTWREVCGQSEFDPAIRYQPAGAQLSRILEEEAEGEVECAVFAFLQTFSNACVALAWQSDQPYESVPKRRWLAHGTAYMVRAATTCSVPKKLHDLAEGGDVVKWGRAANGATRNRAFARTHKGYYVLGPKVMEPGDVISVFHGGGMPFCLRPWGSAYLLVGECYVHGIMDGEMVQATERQGIKEEVFEVV